MHTVFDCRGVTGGLPGEQTPPTSFSSQSPDLYLGRCLAVLCSQAWSPKAHGQEEGDPEVQFYFVPLSTFADKFRKSVFCIIFVAE